jgi:hypothetical protein
MRRRVPTNAVVLLGYVCVSFAYFGWRLLPHPGRPYIGQGRDPQIFIWSFAWWPHAILHGENPFVTHAIFAPDGLNLTWATSIPGLALAFSPAQPPPTTSPHCCCRRWPRLRPTCSAGT